MLSCGRNWPLGLTINTEVFTALFLCFFYVFSSLFFNSVTIYPDLGICTECLMEPMAWFAWELADQNFRSRVVCVVIFDRCDILCEKCDFMTSCEL